MASTVMPSLSNNQPGSRPTSHASFSQLPGPGGASMGAPPGGSSSRGGMHGDRSHGGYTPSVAGAQGGNAPNEYGGGGGGNGMGAFGNADSHAGAGGSGMSALASRPFHVPTDEEVVRAFLLFSLFFLLNLSERIHTHSPYLVHSFICARRRSGGVSSTVNDSRECKSRISRRSAAAWDSAACA